MTYNITLNMSNNKNEKTQKKKKKKNPTISQLITSLQNNHKPNNNPFISHSIIANKFHLNWGWGILFILVYRIVICHLAYKKYIIFKLAREKYIKKKLLKIMWFSNAQKTHNSFID